MAYEVKICGLTRRGDVEAAVECGADYVGFVLVPASKRFVPLDRLAGLTRNLAGVRKVGVFADASLEEIRRAVETGGLDIVQLHGAETPEFARSIDFAEVWKATYDADFPAARLVCDAPQGGSGRFGNHELAAELAKHRPVMLAGGLAPGNVAEVTRFVRPAGVDVASGVESAPGVKDRCKMAELFKAMSEIL